MITAEVQGIPDSCGRLDPRPAEEICPIAGDTLRIACTLDQTGGGGQLSIIHPDQTVVPRGNEGLPDITVKDGGVYTCMARNDDDMCTPSNATIMIRVFG